MAHQLFQELILAMKSRTSLYTKQLQRAVFVALAGPTLANASDRPAAAYSPGPSDPQRKIILDIARPFAERDLGAPVQFVVREFRIKDNWAFLMLDAQRPGGRPVDPTKTPFARRYGNEALDTFDCCHFEAILQKGTKGWRVVEAATGSTDVWYEAWCNRAPYGLISFCQR